MRHPSQGRNKDYVTANVLPASMKSDLDLTPEGESLGSPGNHYTADTVKEYDPSGLRSAMTATHGV